MVSCMIRLMELQWDRLWVQFLQTFLRAILKKSGYCTDARGIVLAKQKTVTRTNHSVRFGVWSHHIIKHGRGRVNHPLILAVVGLSNFPGHFRRHEYFMRLCVSNWTVWCLEFIFSLDWNRAIELKNSKKFSTKLVTGRIHPELQSLPLFISLAIFFQHEKQFPLSSTTTTIFTLFSLTKGSFPVSRNFYKPTYVKFTFANKIYRGCAWKVARKCKSCNSFNFSSASILCTWLKFSCVNMRSQKRVSRN